MWLICPQIVANLPRAGSKLLPERRDGEFSEFRRRGRVSFVECRDGDDSTAAAFVFGRHPMSRRVACHAIRARVDAGVCVHTLQQVLCGGNGWGTSTGYFIADVKQCIHTQPYCRRDI